MEGWGTYPRTRFRGGEYNKFPIQRRYLALQGEVLHLSPGNEKIERPLARLKEEITDYYIIKVNGNSAGGIRIRRYEEGSLCKVGPLFILPEYQNKKIAQKVFAIIEKNIDRKMAGYWTQYYKKKGIVIYMKK